MMKMQKCSFPSGFDSTCLSSSSEPGPGNVEETGVTLPSTSIYSSSKDLPLNKPFHAER